MAKDKSWVLEKAIHQEEHDGIRCFVLKSPLYDSGQSGLNGYVAFPQRPLKDPGYEGIAAYIPVHGGITWADSDPELGFVYGFDTGHCDSEKYPRTDPQWIIEQCKVLIQGIKLAATLEDEYLLAEGNNEKRAEICDKLCALQREHMHHFGLNIRLLTGNL